MFDGEKLSNDMSPKNEEERKQCRKFPYREIVGKLNYLSVWTRPDITFAVNTVSKYCNDPGPKHIMAVKHIVRYLKGTSDAGLFYSYSDDHSLKLELFSDADWANSENRRSVSGFTLMINKVPVCWKSKQQHCVAISTMESEFYALAIAVVELRWFQSFLFECGIEVTKPIVYEDNQSAISFVKNPAGSIKAKHIDIRYHFVKDLYAKDKLDLQYCSSENMVADILTKPLGPKKFIDCLKLLNIHLGGVLKGNAY